MKRRRCSSGELCGKCAARRRSLSDMPMPMPAGMRKGSLSLSCVEERRGSIGERRSERLRRKRVVKGKCREEGRRR
jgi:hypothetical protein